MGSLLRCRYTAIYVGLPSVEEDMVTKDITPQQCRCEH